MLKERLPQKLQEAMDLQNRPDPTQFWGSTEMYILFGAILFIALIFFFWAAYIRKPPKAPSRSLTTSPIPSRNSRRRQKKNRRRRWKNRNPTLAQTGGLPPTKDRSDPD